MAVIVRDFITPRLRQMARRVKDPTPILEAAGLQLVSITACSFNDPSQRVKPWAPLHPRTIAEKVAAGKSTAVLKRDVVLARSWRVTKLTRREVTVGTDRFYAAFHQFGSKRTPARPMLPFLGGPTSASLAPFAREKLQKIAQRKLDTLLAQG